MRRQRARRFRATRARTHARFGDTVGGGGSMHARPRTLAHKRRLEEDPLLRRRRLPPRLPFGRPRVKGACAWRYGRTDGGWAIGRRADGFHGPGPKKMRADRAERHQRKPSLYNSGRTATTRGDVCDDVVFYGRFG